MINLQSPQYSNSSKADLFSKQRSPSIRNKRIPSSHDNYICYSNQNLKINKNDSPSKGFQQIKRRKSHHMQNSTNSNNSANKRKLKVATNEAQDIMSSIQILKQQYKNLKQAYKQLILQKMSNIEQINECKSENLKLKQQLEYFKMKKSIDDEEIQRLKVEIVKLNNNLSQEKKKRRQIQNDLYFMEEKNTNTNNKQQDEKILNEISKQPKFINTQRIDLWRGQKLMDLDQICCKTISNDSSKMMSFQLSSIEETINYDIQKRRQHIKVLSDLSRANVLQIDKNQLSKKKEDGNFKKNKKQNNKQVNNNNIQNRQSKVLLSNVNNPLSQLLYSKSPVNSDKKMIKNQNGSSIKKKKIEDKQNVDIKINKKKSKKPLQLISNE